MKLVTRDLLENWANTISSKATMPYLIYRLVRSTTPISTKANIPSGSATYIGGWDGVVNCEIETAYVPQGTSLWELGTTSDCKGKANDDYDKRKNDSIGFNPSESVFIFATPRLWTKKDEWVKEKKAENHWKDVKAYDSVDLEQWLDNSLPVSRWFASQDGVDAYPFDGIMAADEFWEEWSIGPKGLVLSPECVIAGREYEKDLLLEVLKGEPTIKGIKASTKNEAIAFIIASAKLFPTEEFYRFFSKALIVDTEGNFRGIRINTIAGLNLIPRFDDAQPLHAAVLKGHHVLVPLGADDEFNQETITLPTIDRGGQIDALIKSGISQEDAEKFSRESGRNITILKKLLGFPQYKAKWIEKENIREIIPALLLGRWNETFHGDIELIETLADLKYSDYLNILNKWKNFQESPIIQIGETWRLTSPLDLWAILSSQLTLKDFQNIQECYSLAFKSGNPVIEPSDKEDFAAYLNKRRKYSRWVREGLSQSLILIGRLDEMKIPNLNNPQNWIDSIIFDLLNDANGEMWISVNHDLPLISEASPDSFIKSVMNSLSKDQPEIMDMFREEEGFLHKTSHHTGLLWALENLAWMPEYLRDVSLILLKLSRLDPGGNLANRPFNSISEIFKPWHYQTLASFGERMEILKYVIGQEKEFGWKLLIGMLPSHKYNALSTHKMRWRMFDKNTNLTYTYQEIWKTHSEIIEILISFFDNSEDKFSEIIRKVTTLSPNDRERILEWAEAIYTNVKQEKFSPWHTIRKILNHHRSNDDATWALPESALTRLENLYNKLQPIDIVNKYIWLFHTHQPEFPEGIKRHSSELKERRQQLQSRIDEARKEAVVFFLNELGLEASLELRKQIKEHGLLGDTLAKIITNQEDIISVCACLYDEENIVDFIHSFIYRKSTIEGLDWIQSLFNKLEEKGFSDKALSNILIPLAQNQQLWKFLASLKEEIQSEYWLNFKPRFYSISNEDKEIVIEMLLKYKMYFSAINIVSHFANGFPSNLLSELLKKAAIEQSNDTPKISDYEIERVFEELDKRTDIDRSTIAHLEWLYLPMFASNQITRNPKTLETELANNPEFFIEVIKCIYTPEDHALEVKEIEGISEDQIYKRANQAYQLLYSWKRIPGMREDNSIDEVALHNWISKVRNLGEEVSRLGVVDGEIGKILAQYPENVPEWPQEKIFKVIEDVKSERLNNSYYSAMFNKRGISSRSMFDGGDIERGKAAYFEKLSSDYKNKYPLVAEIFKDLQQNYLSDAKRIDEEAARNKLEY